MEQPGDFATWVTLRVGIGSTSSGLPLSPLALRCNRVVVGRLQEIDC